MFALIDGRLTRVRARTRAERRKIVGELLMTTTCPRVLSPGWRGKVAAELGVSVGTITRDVQLIRQTMTLTWPCCILHADPEVITENREAYSRASLMRSLARHLSPAAIARILDSDAASTEV